MDVTFEDVVSDPELHGLRQQFSEAKDEYEEAREAKVRATERRQEAQRRAEELRREAAREDETEDANRLTSGYDAEAAATATATRRERKLEEAEKLEEEEERAREAYLAKRRESQDLAAEIVRRINPYHRDVLQDRIDAYAELVEAEAPLPQILIRTVIPAEEQHEVVRKEHVYFIGRSGSTGVQKNRVQREIKNAITVGPDVSLGYLIRQLLRWSRLRKSPARDLWNETEIGALNPKVGSVLSTPVFGGFQDQVVRMQRGEIPFEPLDLGTFIS